MPYPYKISVAICTYNRESFLPGLMESVRQQTLSPDLFEILFINNNSTDHTEALCQRFITDYSELSIRYFKETRQGLSFSRNRAIQEAQGEYITFADDDALLTPDFLKTVCDYLDAYPNIAEVGGPILLKYLGAVPPWENPYINSLFGYFYPSPYPYELKNKNTKFPRGSNMTFRTSVFSVCGNFNTSLGRIKRKLIGGEEKDITYRIIEHGLQVAYIPEAIVFHLVPENRTTKNFIREQAQGIGQSEQFRTLNISRTAYLKRLFLEGIKWAGTFVLYVRYLFCGIPQKGNILLFFRWHVSRGLLKK